jgi:hypothetical protein
VVHRLREGEAVTEDEASELAKRVGLSVDEIKEELAIVEADEDAARR